jgi:predicted DCC family thiol-disulfide oxidoreductase YuxK
MLTIFYDGNCPLCAKEMQHLKKKDHDNLINLVDLHQDEFETLYPSDSQIQSSNFSLYYLALSRANL